MTTTPSGEMPAEGLACHVAGPHKGGQLQWSTRLCGWLCGPGLGPWRGVMVVAVEACDPLSVLHHGLLGCAGSHSRPPLCLLSLALGAGCHALRCCARCARCAFQAFYCPLCSLLCPDLQLLSRLPCLLSQRLSLQQSKRIGWSQPCPVRKPPSAILFPPCSPTCMKFPVLAFHHDSLSDDPINSVLGFKTQVLFMRPSNRAICTASG